MPNHITNIINAKPEVLEGLLRKRTQEEFEEHARYEDERYERFLQQGRVADFRPEVLDMEQKVIDFNLLIPCPPDDDPCFTASKTEYGNGMVGWSFDGTSPMDWARTHWGTKWNAYSQQVGTDRIQFDTAWSHPIPVIVALSKKFPDERIEVTYADEDFGSNLAHYIITDGKIIADLTPTDQDGLNELAAQVLYKKTYAEVQAEWDADEIDHARKAAFVRQIERERGIDNGYVVLRDENLTVPQEIIDQIQTVEDAKIYWQSVS